MKAYQSSGTATLIGLGEMHLFRFYVDNGGIPVMRYKKSAVDTHWLPADQPSCRLWKKERSRRPRLAPGCLKPVSSKPMWGSKLPEATRNQEKAVKLARKATLNKGFMMVGLVFAIQYWQNGLSKCEGFATAFGLYVEYWNRVLHELKEPLPDCPLELVEGFWPQHDCRVTPDEIPLWSLMVNPVDVIPEEEDPEAYCGPANEAPRESFNSWLDIRPGSWILLRLDDPAICAVWQGRALSSVCTLEGDVNSGKFLLHYWQLDNFGSTLELRYQNCGYGKWVVENSPPTWVDAMCVV